MWVIICESKCVIYYFKLHKYVVILQLGYLMVFPGIIFTNGILCAIFAKWPCISSWKFQFWYMVEEGTCLLFWGHFKHRFLQEGEDFEWYPMSEYSKHRQDFDTHALLTRDASTSLSCEQNTRKFCSRTKYMLIFWILKEWSKIFKLDLECLKIVTYAKQIFIFMPRIFVKLFGPQITPYTPPLMYTCMLCKPFPHPSTPIYAHIPPIYPLCIYPLYSVQHPAIIASLVLVTPPCLCPVICQLRDTFLDYPSCDGNVSSCD